MVVGRARREPVAYCVTRHNEPCPGSVLTPVCSCLSHPLAVPTYPAVVPARGKTKDATAIFFCRFSTKFRAQIVFSPFSESHERYESFSQVFRVTLRIGNRIGILNYNARILKKLFQIISESRSP